MTRRATVALALCAAIVAGAAGCDEARDGRIEPAPGRALAQTHGTGGHDPWARSRGRLVDQLEADGIGDQRVLRAMRRVPRHEFVPAGLRTFAYDDRPLPIGNDQTISQPYVVARMSELAEVERGERVLEIGTGSGYQAAVLAEMGAEVWSIEIVGELARTARERLARLGYEQVRVRHGDGYQGWREHAPFDAIVLTAAPPRIPEPLKAQLAVGGKLVAPVGEGVQELVVLTRTERGFRTERFDAVRFVPMTGRAQEDGVRR